jgi:hypothetical protein
MPLTNEDKKVLRDCMAGKTDVYKTLQDTIKKYTVTTNA